MASITQALQPEAGRTLGSVKDTGTLHTASRTPAASRPWELCLGSGLRLGSGLQVTSQGGRVMLSPTQQLQAVSLGLLTSPPTASSLLLP